MVRLLAMLVYAGLPLLVGASYLSSELLRVRYIKVQEKISAGRMVLQIDTDLPVQIAPQSVPATPTSNVPTGFCA